MQDGGVNAKLEELRLKAEAQATLAPIVTREWIINEIKGLAQTTQKDSVKLGALIALGKTYQANIFVADSAPDKPADSVEDIDRKLLDLIKGMRTIEGTATPVAPKDTPPAPKPAAASRKRKPRT